MRAAAAYTCCAWNANSVFEVLVRRRPRTRRRRAAPDARCIPGRGVEVDDVETRAARAVLHPGPRDPHRRGEDLVVVALDGRVLSDDPQRHVAARLSGTLGEIDAAGHVPPPAGSGVPPSDVRPVVDEDAPVHLIPIGGPLDGSPGLRYICPSTGVRARPRRVQAEAMKIDIVEHEPPYRVGVIVGSLSRESINRRLATAPCSDWRRPSSSSSRSATATCRCTTAISTADYPQEALDFKAAVRSADALLFVTPEYNRSLPGPAEECHRLGEPPLGPERVVRQADRRDRRASAGQIGTAVGQQSLRSTLSFLNARQMTSPRGVHPLHTRVGRRQRRGHGAGDRGVPPHVHGEVPRVHRAGVTAILQA